MVSKSEYAKLSMAVYTDDEPAGWSIIAGPTEEQLRSGFYAAAYRNDTTNEVVIVYRGTEFPNDLGDLAADAALATDAEHQQFIDALEFAYNVSRSYSTSTITVTGHSLGGGLAQLAADVFGWNGVTFEAPGMAQLRDNAQFANWFSEHADEGLSFGNVGSSFENIVVSGSAISSVGTHMGTVDPAIDTGVGGNNILLLMKAAAIGFAPAVAILSVTEQWATTQLDLHSISNIYQYLERQTAAGTVLQDYIGQYLEHGVDGYDPPSRSFPDIIREFFDDYFNGSQELSQAQAEALIGDLQWLRENDPLLAENTAAMDDLVKAQDMLRIATQDIASVTLDNTHWTEQLGAENQLTIRIGLEHVIEKTSQRLEIKLPDIDLWSGKSSRYVVLNGEAVFVENTSLGEKVFDHFVLNVEPGAEYAELKLKALPGVDEVFSDGKINLGAFNISLPGRSGAGSIEYVGDLTLFDMPAPEPMPIVDSILTNILIQGDMAPTTDADGNIFYDLWGNVIPDGEAPGRGDTIYDTSDSDLIQAAAGNDYVTKQSSGDDVIELGDGDDDLFTIAGATGRIEAYGGDGRDYAGGGGEVDVIEGGAGADGLSGDAGNDRLYGDSAVSLDDFIRQGVSQAGSGEQGEWFDGGIGDDLIVGGAGNDLVAGGDGNDVIVTGGGSDWIWGDEDTYSGSDWRNWSVTEEVKTEADGSKTYTYTHNLINTESDTGTGDDVIHAGGGNDAVFGERGNDTIYLDDGADKSWGGEGDDVIFGGAGDDLLSGDNGTKFLDPALHGDDFLDGGDGDDTLSGNGGADVLLGGAGNDELMGDGADEYAGDDYLDGEDGDDNLFGGAGNDVLYGGNGADMLAGDDSGVAGNLQGADYLDGGEGKDILLGYGGADVLLGGADDDELYGDASDLDGQFHGDDRLDGGTGDDVLVGGGGADQLFGGEGTDQLYGDDYMTDAAYHGSDYLDGGAGDDVLVGGGRNDVLIGGDGADTLDGDSAETPASSHGADLLDGGLGNDVLVGNGGNDTLVGGDDDDELYGDASYLDGSFHGDDLLDGGNGNDSLMGMGGDDVLYGGGGADTLLGDDKTTDGAYHGNDYLDGGDGNDTLFGGGGSDTLIGGEGNDQLDGDDLLLAEIYHGDDVLDGGAGDDVLSGMGGVDTLYGGDGDDVLGGGTGDDYLDGGTGSDRLFGENGSDTLVGNSGDDYLDGGDGDDVIEGGFGNDILLAGPGSDVLDGGDGTDVYVYNLGDGVDYIRDSGSNTLHFGAGINVSNISLALGSLKINVGSGEDAIHIESFDSDDPYANVAVDRFEFADGTVLDYTQLLALGFSLTGTDGADVIEGTVLEDQINGLGGDDILIGKAGNDTLDGGSGADDMRGMTGDDVYRVDDVNDSVLESADEGHDRVESRVSYALSDNVEDLTLVENALNGIGNALGNSIQGNALDNHLEGGEGDDSLNGQAGNDTLEGGAGSDLLMGMDGDDRIVGGEGNDELSGDKGADSLHGDTGDDWIGGGDGDDELFGGDGTDVLYGDAGNDTLIGGTGSDRLEGGTGNDTYEISADGGLDSVLDAEGSDRIYLTDLVPNEIMVRRDSLDLVLSRLSDGQVLARVEGEFSNVAGEPGASAVEVIEFADGTTWDYAAIKLQALVGTEAADNIEGHAEADTVYALGGDDAVLASAGDDEVHGGVGNDVLDGGTGDDSLYGDADADILRGRDGADVLDGGTGDDQLDGGSGDDLLLGGEGDDILEGGDDGTDRLEGGTGNDVLEGGMGNDSLYGDADADILRGGDGADVLDGGTGDDQLDGGAGDDLLQGGDGNDILQGGSGTDRLEGGAGDDTLQGNGELYGDAGADAIDGTGLLSGGAGDDTITGYGSDELLGGDGNDVLTANSDPWNYGVGSVLEGGKGDDVLYGTFSDDTYRFGLGDGNDGLIERRAGQAYTNFTPSFDTLSFGTGIALVDLTFERHGDDLVVRHANGTDSVTIERWFEEPTDHYKVNRFAFADGTELSDTDVEARLVTYGTAATDTLFGYRALDEELYAGDGDDQVWGRDGDDMLYGEAGADYLDGEAGVDWLYGGAGADTLWGGDGNDTLDGGIDADSLGGGDGDDVLLGQDGDDNLSGEAGADRLEGGAGDDYLAGGADDDVLLGGDGADYLVGDGGDDQLRGGLGDDKYVYANGQGADVVDNSDGGYDGVFFTDVGLDRLAFNRDGDDLLIAVDGDPAQSVRVLDHFLGGDAAIDYVQPNGGYMLDTQHIAHIAAANSLEGGYATAVVGSEGADSLSAYDTRDLVQGLGGDDTLWGMAGDDRIEGGTGNDALYGGNGSGQGSGADELVGGVGDDVLNGEDGDDVLMGGAGNDDYYYGEGSGVDVIDNAGGGTDIVYFIGGIDRSRLSFHHDGDDLVMLLDGELDQQVRVLNHFLGGDAAISYVQPTDGGYAIAAADIDALLTALPGTSGGDTGGAGTVDTPPPDGGTDTVTPPAAQTGGADSLTGTSGNDVLLGGADNDTLDGNGGSDLLRGGTGDDTYFFGGGQAVLAEEDGADTLRFTNGITFNSVASGLMKSGDDLILTVNGGPDQVTLQGFFRGGAELIETMTFDTGGGLTADQIFGAFGLPVPDGVSPYAATVEGSNGDDALVLGGADAERLLAYNGNDTLEGAGGNDLLIGGRGDDTYVFRSGDGQDVIDNTGGGYDTLQFADAGFSAVASGLMKSGDDLVLKVNGGPDQVTLRGFFRGGDEAIDRLTFSDGSQLDKAQIFGAFGLGDPDPDGSPNYTSLPDERAYGTVQAARAGGETLLGSSDADLIDGGAGDDTLDSGTGDDWLIGGRGDDVFLQGRGGGTDTLTAYDPTVGKTDTLRFGVDIGIDQLWFERSGDDLSVSVIGTGDSATISGWYAGEAYHVESIETADGHVLLDAQVENLVSAMAAFAPPAAGETTLPTTYQNELQPVIAANWQ